MYWNQSRCCLISCFLFLAVTIDVTICKNTSASSSNAKFNATIPCCNIDCFHWNTNTDHNYNLYLPFKCQQIWSRLRYFDCIIYFLLPHHFMSDETVKTKIVRSFRTIFYKTKCTSVLFEPFGVFRSSRLKNLYNGCTLRQTIFSN